MRNIVEIYQREFARKEVLVCMDKARKQHLENMRELSRARQRVRK